MDTCKWYTDEYGDVSTDCSEVLDAECVNDEWVFCPYCGQHIEKKK